MTVARGRDAARARRRGTPARSPRRPTRARLAMTSVRACPARMGDLHCEAPEHGGTRRRSAQHTRPRRVHEPDYARRRPRPRVTWIASFCRHVVSRVCPPWPAFRSRHTTEKRGVPVSGPGPVRSQSPQCNRVRRGSCTDRRGARCGGTREHSCFRLRKRAPAPSRARRNAGCASRSVNLAVDAIRPGERAKRAWGVHQDVLAR